MLGKKVGEGGEGAIYLIADDPAIVLKLYRKPVSGKKLEKLKALIKIDTPSLRGVTAWPIDLVVNRRGETCGFVMNRVVGSLDVHELYSPKSRTSSFPEADFRFVCHVATNLARAFAEVHKSGVVIGDVNQGSVLVSAKGTIALIDCDSFQIREYSNLFTCDVGVPLFTPPELQGRPFRGMIRQENHDLFGLAVLLFHLLYLGRHPYAGVFSGSGESQIERFIAENRFAYGSESARLQMTRPPGTICLESHGRTIAGMFERAFSIQGANGSRPKAIEWIGALDELGKNLKSCGVPGHSFLRTVSQCPWCAIEARAAVRLFGRRSSRPAVEPGAGIEAVWKSILSIQGPTPDPPLPNTEIWIKPVDFKGRPVPKVHPLRYVLSLAVWGAAIVGVVQGESFILFLLLSILGACLWPGPDSSLRSALNMEKAQAEREWKLLLEKWNKEGSREAFHQILQALQVVWERVGRLHSERARRIALLEAKKRETNLSEYLDRFRIDTERIPDIGPSRAAMLNSFGIESAADIRANDIQRIPGFGPVLTGTLLRWRKDLESRFIHDPSKPISPGAIAQVDADIDSMRSELQRELEAGRAKLLVRSKEIELARRELLPTLQQAWNRFKLAELELNEL